MPSPVPVRSGEFTVQGHRLAYEVYGTGGEPCVLMHGILLDSLINRDLAIRFANTGYQVVLLDLLGHGRSAKVTDPKEHRVDFYAEHVVALLDHLGWERALIGGMSLGAITAMMVAVRAPERVRGLYLEMPVMEWSMPWAVAILAPILLSTRFARPVYLRFAQWLSRRPRPSKDWMASGMNALSMDPKVTTAILHGVLVGPIAPSVRQRRALDMPTLIVGHGRDKLHEYRDALALQRQLPQARLIDAHSLLELRMKPERLWPQIEAFLLDLVADGQPRRTRRRRG